MKRLYTGPNRDLPPVDLARFVIVVVAMVGLSHVRQSAGGGHSLTTELPLKVRLGACGGVWPLGTLELGPFAAALWRKMIPGPHSVLGLSYPTCRRPTRARRGQFHQGTVPWFLPGML